MSQSISVSPVANHSSNGANVFPTKSGTLSLSNDNLRLAGAAETVLFGSVLKWALSPGGMKLAVLSSGPGAELQQIDHSAHELYRTEFEFIDPSDETISIYPFDDGRVVVQDNVANFTFLDAGGEVVHSVSNSSQSLDGEQSSQLAADPSGRTIVLYNPVIAYGRQTGSQARLVYGAEDHELFFRNKSREISHVEVSKNGELMTILSTGAGNDELVVFDRFGNELNTITTDKGQIGASLSGGGEYVTLYSGGRIQVFNTITGERLGSTSTRSPVLEAYYDPQDEVVVALGGSVPENGTQISDPVLTAVHLTKRQIARENISFSLSTVPNMRIGIERNESGRYRISGLNRHLNMTVQF